MTVRLTSLFPPGAEVTRLVEHQLAAPHDVGLALGAASATPAPQHGADAFDQQTLRERLGDVVVGAHAQAQHLVQFVVLGGEEDHRHVAVLPQPAEQLQPVHARHLDVENGKVDRLSRQAGERFGAVGVGEHAESLRFQSHRDRGEDIAIVVDESDGFRQRFSFRSGAARSDPGDRPAPRQLVRHRLQISYQPI